MAAAFVADVRRDLERAALRGEDLPPRLRIVHTRPGHATPEYRTLAVPVPNGCEGASPEVLSRAIARYAALDPPTCLFLVLDAVRQEGETTVPILIAEARDRWGTRLYLIQSFRTTADGIEWGDAAALGWRDPSDDELILDAAFALPVPTPVPETAEGPRMRA
jgi:hypothetical protein